MLVHNVAIVHTHTHMCVCAQEYIVCCTHTGTELLLQAHTCRIPLLCACTLVHTSMHSTTSVHTHTLTQACTALLAYTHTHTCMLALAGVDVARVRDAEALLSSVLQQQPRVEVAEGRPLGACAAAAVSVWQSRSEGLEPMEDCSTQPGDLAQCQASPKRHKTGVRACVRGCAHVHARPVRNGMRLAALHAQNQVCALCMD